MSPEVQRYNPISKEVVSEEVIVTPELAEYLLENNALNRPISDQQVSDLADQMRRGLWEFNGEPIILSREGTVLDGQHRLWAAVESRKSFKTLITKGIDKDTFHTIDTGRKRSGADVLAIHGKLTGSGIKYNTQVSAAITICLEYQRGLLKHKGRGDAKVSRADIVRFYEDNPSIEQWVIRSKVKKDWAGAYSASASAICFLAAKKYEMKAVEFMHGFITGEELNGRSPILALRTKLGVEKRMFKWERISLMIWAMNAFIDNKELTLLKPPKGEIPLIKGTEPAVKAKPVAKPGAKVPAKPGPKPGLKPGAKGIAVKGGLHSLHEVFRDAGVIVPSALAAPTKTPIKKGKTK